MSIPLSFIHPALLHTFEDNPTYREVLGEQLIDALCQAIRYCDASTMFYESFNKQAMVSLQALDAALSADAARNRSAGNPA